ncbi:unnamed protein product [Pseudo-nitzschia multistriata]|uniref:Uncharacterized protein n=1 Tax=Pseudo-nitzschia multistriata TaxID=183589 RepID=A0A448ZLI1_9STRA|nr:unnamed protein product [Pseudo-nitzschia multistriata]
MGVSLINSCKIFISLTYCIGTHSRGWTSPSRPLSSEAEKLLALPSLLSNSKMVSSEDCDSRTAGLVSCPLDVLAADMVEDDED